MTLFCEVTTLFVCNDYSDNRIYKANSYIHSINKTEKLKVGLDIKQYRFIKLYKVENSEMLN
jgi:hypothetical protein